MKKTVLFCAFMAMFTLGAFAQNIGGYIVTNLVTYDQAKLTAALDKCRFDNYRKYDERVTLTFEDGTTVELLSVVEMQHEGLACDTKIITPSTHKQQNVFILHPDGYITELVNRDVNSAIHKKHMLDKQNTKP